MKCVFVCGYVLSQMKALFLGFYWQGISWLLLTATPWPFNAKVLHNKIKCVLQGLQAQTHYRHRTQQPPPSLTERQVMIWFSFSIIINIMLIVNIILPNCSC